ncbi:MAG: mechanosensitive ion channel domain-containing protein [Minisyncoccales bacterium]
MEIGVGKIFADIFNAALIWVGHHGVRVILILLAAAAASALVKTILSRRKIMPVLDNLPHPAYKYKKVFGASFFRQTALAEVRKQRIATLIKTTNNILRSLIWIVAAIAILPEFGVNITPILASLGLAGLAIGMAAKDIITDFIAGSFIILEGGYNIGDKVEIAGFSGKVLEISLRRTILRGEDGVICAVPNREVKLIKKFDGREKEVEQEDKVKITNKSK